MHVEWLTLEMQLQTSSRSNSSAGINAIFPENAAPARDAQKFQLLTLKISSIFNGKLK